MSNKDDTLFARALAAASALEVSEVEGGATIKPPSAASIKYPDPPKDRDDTIARIKAGLKRRSKKTWSVTGGRGTSWGWIHISAPPKRLIHGSMSPEDRVTLATLLGEDHISHDHIGIPASNDYRTEYVDRAEGRRPRKLGVPYWD